VAAIPVNPEIGHMIAQIAPARAIPQALFRKAQIPPTMETIAGIRSGKTITQIEAIGSFGNSEANLSNTIPIANLPNRCITPEIILITPPAVEAHLFSILIFIASLFYTEIERQYTTTYTGKECKLDSRSKVKENLFAI
jgi:hypothetical protein